MDEFVRLRHVQRWKAKYHDECVILRQAQKAKAIEKAYAPLILNLEQAASNDAIKEQARPKLIFIQLGNLPNWF